MLRALLFSTTLLAQTAVPYDLREAVWDAVRPALAFPAATERQEPVDGNATARWIVRRARSDEGALVAEVIANPLNPETQTRAAWSMAAIQQEVFAAERRAQVEFERAREAARRSGASVAVQGITLDDEGVAGDRADGEERMTIEMDTRRVEHASHIDAVDAPTVRDNVSGAPWLVKVPAREVQRDGESRAQYYPAQAIVYFASAKPIVNETGQRLFTVRATGDNVVAVILRGNSGLIDEVIARADWSRVRR